MGNVPEKVAPTAITSSTNHIDVASAVAAASIEISNKEQCEHNWDAPKIIIKWISELQIYLFSGTLRFTYLVYIHCHHFIYLQHARSHSYNLRYFFLSLVLVFVLLHSFVRFCTTKIRRNGVVFLLCTRTSNVFFANRKTKTIYNSKNPSCRN